MDNNTVLFFQIFNLSGKWQFLDALMIFGAEYLIIFSYLFIILLFFTGQRRDRKALLLTAGGLIIGAIITFLIRLFYQQPRPFVTFPINPLINKVDLLSFPSTHTLTMAVVAFSFYFYHSKFAPLLIFFLIWVGFSRIYVGVHYPLDILGGLIVGIISVHLIWAFKNYLKRKLISH